MHYYDEILIGHHIELGVPELNLHGLTVKSKYQFIICQEFDCTAIIELIEELDGTLRSVEFLALPRQESPRGYANKLVELLGLDTVTMRHDYFVEKYGMDDEDASKLALMLGVEPAQPIAFNATNATSEENHVQ